MTDLAIRATGLSKQYRLGGTQSYRTLRESIASFATAPFRGTGSAILHGRRPRSRSSRETIWALSDVSFDIGHGETVAIVGRNGSGKSTLLKLLSRITEPTHGSAEIYGRVAALLEVGTGFHPELTGRENIYLNGAILGMSRAEIQSRFDEIVAFSEIERFLDTPVKYYSSGMYVRLAFSVAAHLEPDILVVDEVLAVGDMSFQKKCLGKMEDVAHGGRTVLFVSHNMPAVLNLCRRAILLQSGSALADGEVGAIVQQYLQGMEGIAGTPLSERTDRRGSGDIRFLAFELRSSDSLRAFQAITGADLEIALSYEQVRHGAVSSLQVAIGIHGRFDENLCLLSSEISGANFGTVPVRGALSCFIRRLPLLPGRYTFTLFATVNGEVCDWIENAGVIDVEPGDFFGTGRLPPPQQGALLIEHDWHISG